MKSYYVLDNGERPFKVDIENNNVIVYKIEYISNSNDIKYAKEPILIFNNVNNIFIGKSPKNAMTTYSGGHGKKFDGNTILLNIKDKKYVFIGLNIFSFIAEYDIIKYVSPVGNSGVPYPYAVDKNNNFYLMIEDVMIKNIPKNINPYDYYFKKSEKFYKMYHLYIGKNDYNLGYTPRPKEDYLRISKFKSFGSGIKIIHKDGKEQKLGLKEYIKFMNEYGKKNNLSPLRYVKLLHDRL
jgi:hypothetical protein